MSSDISLFEERYERIYKLRIPMQAKELEKRLKKFKLPFKGATIKKLAEALAKLTNGRYTVREVWRKIRVIYPNISVTVSDIAEIYELLEYHDIVEYIGSRKLISAEKEVKQEAPAPPAPMPPTPQITVQETTMTLEAPPAAPSVDALKQTIIDIRSDMEELKKGFEELFSTLEEVGSPSVEAAPLPKERAVLEEAIKAGAKKLFEKLFQINEFIEFAMASTKEGDPIVSASRFGTEFITEGAIATALAVILHTSGTSSESLKMGEVFDVMVYTTQGIMIIKPFLEDYFMAFLVRGDARLGLVVRDIETLMNELERLVREVASIPVKAASSHNP